MRHLSRSQDTIQLLKPDDCGTEQLDSISLPLYSDYTFIRKPVSLLVQLEIGRLQELKGLAKNWPIIWYHLTFERSCLVESLLRAFASLFIIVARYPQLTFL